ncbi:MAG: SDR family NAD(P)-dependent oxidoreductase [Solirubrobacteraceae bacterium]|nr:SDR family NAD(P)-dependent oxidoreductase [Solirubrobacteraceae bacterium]
MRRLARALRVVASGGRVAPGLAVVTGTSSGIGRATAILLASRGYRVIAGVRRPEDAESLDRAHDRIEPFFLDVTNQEHLEALAERLSREDDGLALLVNNAGVAGLGPVEVVPMERWEDVIGVNVLGTIAVTRASLPALFRAKGRIVNVNSPSGSIAFPMLGPYSVSKFAMQALTDTLRREGAPGGVTVTSVSPGMIATDIFDKSLKEGRELMGRVYPPELHDRYGELAVGAIVAGEDAIHGGGKSPLAAAALVVHAATVRRPRTRYLQGVENQAVRILSSLPDKVGDALIAQVTRGDYTPPPEVLAGKPGPGNLPPSKFDTQRAA